MKAVKYMMEGYRTMYRHLTDMKVAMMKLVIFLVKVSGILVRDAKTYVVSNRL